MSLTLLPPPPLSHEAFQPLHMMNGVWMDGLGFPGRPDFPVQICRRYSREDCATRALEAHGPAPLQSDNDRKLTLCLLNLRAPLSYSLNSLAMTFASSELAISKRRRFLKLTYQLHHAFFIGLLPIAFLNTSDGHSENNS